jgi:hypothetical protein
LTERRHGEPVKGVWAGLIFPTTHRKPHKFRLGPTDRSGRVAVDREWIVEKIEQNMLDCPMDYSGVAALRGDVRIEAMRAENVARLGRAAEEPGAYAKLLDLDDAQLQSLHKYADLLRDEPDLLTMIDVSVEVSPDWAGRLTVAFP